MLIYPVDSIRKPFTASLLARYVAAGKLDDAGRLQILRTLDQPENHCNMYCRRGKQ